MLNWFRLANKAIKDGNEYRKTLKTTKPKPVSYPTKQEQFFMTKERALEIELQKAQYEYWNQWTGSRFEKILNPYIDEDYYIKNAKSLFSDNYFFRRKEFLNNIKRGQTITSEPHTGFWK